MRVTVIGHSCLRVETRVGTILVDPWLSGSCYWRSWWHFPPSAEADDLTLSPDYVYLTHHHFDHFHFPSMRRLDRGAQMLIPRFGVDVMAGELERLGFASPRELPHGQVLDLGHGVRVASYQYGFDDTTFVIADGDDVIVDVNDCKPRGRALRQIAKAFGRPTMVLKSHSFAQSYPVLYEAEDPADLTLVSAETYISDFRDTVAVLRPRYAIPFGSMVGFLHPESRPVNEHLITPGAVKEAMMVRGVDGTDVVPMAPGDIWSSTGGFELSEYDWYTDRESHLEELTRIHQVELDQRAIDEEGRDLDWDTFESYMTRFVREVPRLLGRRLVPLRFVFRVSSDADTPYWWVSLAERAVGRSATEPSDRSGITDVAEAVLADAIRDTILHMVHGSMRIRTRLAAGGVNSDLGFWGLLMIWEIGYLPLRRSVRRPRIWVSAARRWREVISQVPLVFAKSPVDRLAEGFGADTSRTHTDREPRSPQ